MILSIEFSWAIRIETGSLIQDLRCELILLALCAQWTLLICLITSYRMKGNGVFILVLAGWGLIGLLILTTAVEAAPGPTDYAVNNQRDFRSRRGFKTVGLATARGFGKRTPSLPSFSAFQDDQLMQQEENPNSDLDTYDILMPFSIFQLTRFHTGTPLELPLFNWIIP